MMALRGILGLIAAAALIGFVIAYGAGALNTDPRVVSDLPPQSAGIAERSTVEYRGVVVGTVESASGDAHRTRLVLRLSPGQAGRIPAGVRTRVLPRTLFGDQYVDLVPPEVPSGHLDLGAPIPPDDSAGTVALYTAYTRLYGVLQALQPARITAALATVSEALDGRGARLGRLIDQAHDLTDEAPALLKTFGDTLGFVSDLSSRLSDVAPQGIQALKDATVLSEHLTGHREDIEALLSGGLALSDQARQLLDGNQDRIIKMVDSGGKVLGTTAQHASGLGDLHDGLDRLLTALPGPLSQGPWLSTESDVTFEGNRPYTGADCPRYGELTGPNCTVSQKDVPEKEPPPNGASTKDSTAPGGTSGPVGSEQEAAALRAFAARLPDAAPASASRDGLLGLLAGPLLRGAEVLVP
ncbi:MCE family protein [Amycolatopsis sp. NBC_00345]|uniref:MCE family protein n=1 Tax=Amycolatopsis sp. NBC_00345 TaxID=2975955 RepID=UPI002E2755B7